MYETFDKNERHKLLNSKLNSWKGKLTTHERGDVAKALDIHPRVLDNYIRGAGKAITTCEAIVGHLEKYYAGRLTSNTQS